MGGWVKGEGKKGGRSGREGKGRGSVRRGVSECVGWRWGKGGGGEE